MSQGPDSIDRWLCARGEEGKPLIAVAQLLRAGAGGGAASVDEQLVAAYFGSSERTPADLVRLWEDGDMRRSVASVGRLFATLEIASRPVRTGPPMGRWLGRGALLAASVAAVLVGGRYLLPVPRGDDHRSVGITPVQISVVGPAGAVDRIPLIAWQPVMGAERYEVVVTGPDGGVVYRTSTTDTAVQLPDGVVTLHVPHFFRIRAQLEAGRWIASEFTEFVVRP